MPHRAAERRQSIDLLRIVAAFGIVYAHLVAPGYQVAALGLGLFVILTAFLSFQTLDRGDERRFWLGRLVRFALPWAVWSAVYGIVAWRRFGGPDPALDEKAWSPWLIGTAEHLWYLPFVLVTSPLVWVAARLLRGAAALWAAAISLGPVGAAAIAVHDSQPMEPFVQWAAALTPTLYGLLSAAAARRPGQGAGLAPFLFIALATGPGLIGRGSLAPAIILGSALLFEVAWRMPAFVRDGGRLQRVGSLAFGIYLVHPILVLIWYKLVPLGGSDPGRAVGAVVVFLATVVAVLAIRRFPYGSLIA